MNLLAVILMGGAGAAARYGISLLLLGESSFPVSTLLINGVGCFLLSAVLYLPLVYPQLPRWLLNGLGPGFLGAFTTFSAFSAENASLFLKGHYATVFLYVSVSLLTGLAAAWAGFHVCRLFFHQKTVSKAIQKATRTTVHKAARKNLRIHRKGDAHE